MPNLSWWQDFRKSRLSGFVWFLYKRFNEVRVPQVSASLTFTTLLALVPVLTVTLVVVSAFPMFDNLSDAFVHFVNRTIVPQGADTVFEYINDFQSKASKLTAIGIIMLVVTSLMLIQTIDQTFNRIWRVSTQRPLWMQFLVYWALLTFGPVTLGIGLSLWSSLLTYSRFGESFPLFAGVLRVSFSIAFTTVLLWLLYRLVPNRFVPARHAFVGAMLTALLLETARYGFAWYVSTFNGYTLIYGAFAAIPFFLLWLNLLWMLVLSGAVLTASLSYWQGEAFRRSFDVRGRFDDVLKILLLLHEAQKKGSSLKVQDFRPHINMGYDELGELLEKLARHGYVYHGKQGWVLKTNAASIELSDLFKFFVYRPTRLNRNEVNAAIDKIMHPCLDTLNITLAEFETRARDADEAGRQEKP
ncbi:MULTISPECIES: YihY family inner membrane protein [unclassified Neisseria]|uniref:YihY family inner membrane protein n=1 Tax=unclassified Neisseria TaxID=2623750 RepID=UPI0026650ECF|nr:MULTISPECIES: YihY family inner membrane protein [unclassified Neisseria]MDO1510758.1 YihY family inner membrane protein [Neisseria sp. MVDL19-042950]MDO1517047.1 YihY family inner membrane protein [Neisseria sp. MVDL18-041461]MDO1564410.1 YihY family inner membrane protein [Neisseria sp. MVDL20-010259]